MSKRYESLIWSWSFITRCFFLFIQLWTWRPDRLNCLCKLDIELSIELLHIRNVDLYQVVDDALTIFRLAPILLLRLLARLFLCELVDSHTSLILFWATFVDVELGLQIRRERWVFLHLGCRFGLRLHEVVTIDYDGLALFGWCILKCSKLAHVIRRVLFAIIHDYWHNV